MTSNKWKLYIDGASKGNPGEAGIGVVVYQNGHIIKNIAEYIGITTNNVAEYSALLFALTEALINNIRRIHIYTDSELLYKQIAGEYRVKEERLKVLFRLAKHMLAGFGDVDISNIPRGQNQGADKLATQAIEKRPVLSKKTKKIKTSQDDQLLDFV